MNKNYLHSFLKFFKKKKKEEDIMREESFKAVYRYAMWGAIILSITRFLLGFIIFIKDLLKTPVNSILKFFRITR